jgi:hypothetical protein
MDDHSASTESDPAHTSFVTRYRRTQLVVAIASVICLMLFWYAGDFLHILSPRGFEASILRQSYWPLDILAIYVLLGAAVAIGTVVAGRWWFFAGLFAAAIGLMAISTRGGPMRYVLFEAATDGSPRGVFLSLAIEQCLLFLPLALMWVFFSRRYAAALPPLETADEKKESAGSLPMTLLMQFVATGALLLLLAPTDAKKQVLVGGFVACFGGTALSETFFPDRKAAAWYWISPLLLGVLGYVMAYINTGDFTTGSATGTFANLAHPLPLDYAGAGIAGTLLGYWTGAERPELVTSMLGTLLTGHYVAPRTAKSRE